MVPTNTKVKILRAAALHTGTVFSVKLWKQTKIRTNNIEDPIKILERKFFLKTNENYKRRSFFADTASAESVSRRVQLTK